MESNKRLFILNSDNKYYFEAAVNHMLQFFDCITVDVKHRSERVAIHTNNERTLTTYTATILYVNTKLPWLPNHLARVNHKVTGKIAYIRGSNFATSTYYLGDSFDRFKHVYPMSDFDNETLQIVDGNSPQSKLESLYVFNNPNLLFI